jgi:FkbM family methyltransferase
MVPKLKLLIREFACDRLHIPYQKNGIPFSLLRHLEKKQPVVLIDVGAHEGDFTAAVSSHSGITRGVLVEPLPQKVASLQKRFVLPTYQVFACALSSRTGMTDFEVNEFDATSSLLKMQRHMPELTAVSYGEPKNIKCHTRTLDDLVAEANINWVHLLKIDVQGAEHLVIQGATNILKTTSMVWTEVSFKPLYEMSTSFSEIYELLGKANFKLVELEPGFRAPDGELLQADALFINSASER